MFSLDIALRGYGAHSQPQTLQRVLGHPAQLSYLTQHFWRKFEKRYAITLWGPKLL